MLSVDTAIRVWSVPLFLLSHGAPLAVLHLDSDTPISKPVAPNRSNRQSNYEVRIMLPRFSIAICGVCIYQSCDDDMANCSPTMSNENCSLPNNAALIMQRNRLDMARQPNKLCKDYHYYY